MAASQVTVEGLLSVANMIGLIQTVKGGIPEVLPQPFYSNTRQVMGDYCTFMQTQGSRRLPKTSTYGAQSRVASKQPIAEVPVKLIHTIENQQFGQIVLQNIQTLTSTGTSIVAQRAAIDEITRQTVEFKRRFYNLRTAAITGALSNGKLWIGSDGTFLPSSSGASVTVDFQIPVASAGVGNNGTMAAILGSTQAPAGWQTASTDIISQLIYLKTRATQLTGYPLKYAFYGANIPKYLMANTTASALIVRSPNYREDLLSAGDIPNGFQGLIWIPVYTAFFEDDTGTVQTFFDPDTIIFTPDITSEWYEMIEGSYFIPASPDLITGGNAGQIVQAAQTPYGMFAYATRTTDPIGIKQIMGDTFLPVIKNPQVIFQAKVNF